MSSPFFNEDHESIREMARDFAAKTLAPLAADIDKNEEFPMDVVRQMADMGFLGLKIPEEFGGLGLDMRSYVCVMENFQEVCHRHPVHPPPPTLCPPLPLSSPAPRSRRRSTCGCSPRGIRSVRSR